MASWQTKLCQLTPPHRHVVLPSADYTLKDPPFHHFYLDSVETTRWAFSPRDPLLLRAGKLRYHKVNQPWETEWVSGVAPVLELWNYQEGKQLAVHPDIGAGFQFSPDGRRFAMSKKGEISGELEIWDTTTCRVERVLRPHAADELTFNTDGRRLLAVNAGEHASLFDVDTGQEVQTWQGKKGDWQAFALSPDGALAASGGEDRMIRLWDTATGRELARWQGHDSGVTALLFSRDVQTLYSGSQDGTLKLWNLPFLRKELKALELDW